jgi:hypothetical protein
VIIELVAEILDQRVVHHVEEIVRGSPAVVLQRIEPTRRNIGVPGQHHAAARKNLHGGAGASHERGGKRSRRDRRLQHSSPAQPSLFHIFLPAREPCINCNAAMQDCLGFLPHRQRAAEVLPSDRDV